MKKIIFFAAAMLALLTTSCSNDDIQIDYNTRNTDVNVTVSLSNFFSGYNYNDTRNGISVTEDYRTFNSEFGYYIHVRTMFYNSQGNLVDSLVTFTSTTNAVTKSLKLAEGTYTVISTLNFSESDNADGTLWEWCDREKLSTTYIEPYSRFSIWAIMSYASQTIQVKEGSATTISMTPAPIGALGYLYFQNFQYKNESTYGTVADNGIRELALYSQNVADGYRLDPGASEKFIYQKATGAGSWYYLSDQLTPARFENSKDYGYFRTNIYSYFYILAPQFNYAFGYELEGDSGFNVGAQSNATISNGKTYLAYWDWFKVGEPYFGIADNNHWNTYK